MSIQFGAIKLVIQSKTQPGPEVKANYDRFYEQLQADNAGNPEYRALFFDRPNGSKPFGTPTPQKLLIDGEDAARLQKDVFDKAFFNAGSVGRYSPGRYLDAAMRDVVGEIERSLISEIRGGNRENVIDLDA